jgi:5-methylcytosine-specific restriction endonuclease McrA
MNIVEYKGIVYVDPPRNKNGRIRWDVLVPNLKETLSEAQNHKCCYCGTPFSYKTKAEQPTFEHAVPLVHGGVDHPDNMAIACDKCNNDRARELNNEQRLDTRPRIRR